jgi:hypothetical protein
MYQPFVFINVSVIADVRINTLMAVAKSLDKTKIDVAKHVTLSKAKGLYPRSRDPSLCSE